MDASLVVMVSPNAPAGAVAVAVEAA